jgi:large subunit ribosomal protein L19e
MNLKVQKRLAAQILNCSPGRVTFDNDRLEDIKQAITKRDLKLLIGDGAITRKPGNFTSKVRARKLALQKRKGRRDGPGSRKGKFAARFKPKRTWMNLLRVQREFLKLLLEKKIITRQAYRELYLKSKGGYFRSKRHIKLYLQEHDELLFDKDAIKKVPVESENNKKSKKIIKQ